MYANGLAARGMMTACLAAAIAFIAPASAAQIRIGVSLPLSGTAAPLGNQYLAGATFALEEAERAEDVELVPVDDGCDAGMAGLAADELRAAGLALVTGFLCNDAVPPVASALTESGIPLLVSGARSAQLLKDAQKEGWTLFRIAPADGRMAEAAFDALSERWRGMPWAVIDDGTVYGRTLADELRARMEEIGQPPAFADTFRPAQSTQAGLVRRLQRAGVSAAFVAGDAEDVAILWSNIKELGSKVEIAGGESLESLPMTPDATGVPDGLVAIIEADLEALPGSRVLAARLSAAGIDPEPHVFAGYAAMQIALAALGTSPPETVAKLRRTRFETVIGPVEFNESGQNLHDNYGLYLWRGGSFVETGRIGQ